MGEVTNQAALTGADVAASDDLTGSAARGGDWLLEQHTGQIEAAVAADARRNGMPRRRSSSRPSSSARWPGTPAASPSGAS